MLKNGEFLVVMNEAAIQNNSKSPKHLSTMLIFGEDWYLACDLCPGGCFAASFDGIEIRTYKRHGYLSLPSIEKARGKRYDNIRESALAALAQDNS
jgi:hypothetical protein